MARERSLRAWLLTLGRCGLVTLRRCALGVALVGLSCTPPAASSAVSNGKGCNDTASCERALLAAPDEAVRGVLARHRAVTGDAGWSELFSRLESTKSGVVVVGSDTGRPAPTAHTVSRDALLLRLGRAAHSHHILLPEASVQLFPTDALAPHMLGLAPVVSLDGRQTKRAIAIAEALRTALSNAAAFDYVAAAASVDTLRGLLQNTSPGDEGALRARFGLWLLESAGIALTSDEGDPSATELAPLAPTALPPKLSSPYAEMLAVQLSRPGHQAAWTTRQGRIVKGLSPERRAALQRMYAPDDTCPGPLAPPIEHPADVAFAALLALSLDDDAAPDTAPAAGKLGMVEWLERYDRLVQLVEASGSAWAVLSSLLRQRGELFGLTAEGTGAYQRVTSLGLKHIEALSQLAASAPSRFQPLAVITLVYQPGVLGDRRLEGALAQLVEKSVTAKIAAARDTSSLFDAGLAALAAGMSYPKELQLAQFTALKESLDDKLGGAFGKQPSWAVAGLHAAHATLAALLGEDDALARGAERLAASLRGTVAYASLARLTAAAARYVELAQSSALDPSISNPAMFDASRTQARSELGRAIAALADSGPESAPDKQFELELTQLADELVVAGIAKLTAKDEGPRCRTPVAMSTPRAPLDDAIDRLRKKQKALLASRAFDHGDGAWLRRARLVALVVSDGIDLLARRGPVSFHVASQRAATLIDEGLRGWIDGAGADLAGGLYLLARSGLFADASDTEHAARVMRALGAMFAGDSALFAALAKISARANTTGVTTMGDLLTNYARSAYAAGALDHGDLLLMIGLATRVISEHRVDRSAIDLAKQHGRGVYLPLLLFGDRGPASQPELEQAMVSATNKGCGAPDPSAVVTLQRAALSFKAGRHDEALMSLGNMLDEAEARGIVVPRQVFRFEQHRGKTVFNVEESVSFGNELLRGASAFEIGLSLSSRVEHRGTMSARFADPKSSAAEEEAARYFAHAALVQAVYAFVAGHDDVAVGAARRAIGTWIAGTKLGRTRVAVGANSAAWARDATATLLVAGQLAADRGLIFVAGDLWTLAKASLDPAIDDESLRALLTPYPVPLADIPELEALRPAVEDVAVTLTAASPCTTRRGDPTRFVRVGCDAYPKALALRATDSLTVLPRLKKPKADTVCEAWSHLDRFLAAADEGRYEPKRLIAAVTHLEQRGAFVDAASVLTRHRHPDHCNPKLVKAARQLAGHQELGMHLIADLWSIATNCDAPENVGADLLELDRVTQLHALPRRNFEVLLFAVRLALKHNQWAPLASMATDAHFIQRYNALGPELGTAALMVDHAARVGSGQPLDLEGSLPFYRLLCTTFPPQDRAATCHAITLLRGSGSAADKKRTAAKTLASFLQRAAAAVAPPPGPAP